MPESGRPWTSDKAIEAVQSFHRERGYQPVSSEAGPVYGLPCWATAKRLFGSWNAMIETAGFVPYPPKNSANAKTRAFRDRNPDWREKLSGGVTVTQRA